MAKKTEKEVQSTEMEEVVETTEMAEIDDVTEMEEVVGTTEMEEDNVPEPVSVSQKTKIYINGELFGTCENPVEFTQEMREKRRKGQVSHEMNITYYEDNNEIYIFNVLGIASRKTFT